MIKRLASLALILFGGSVSIISLIADPLGIGANPVVLGWKQLTGAFTGVFIAIFGLWIQQFPSNDKNSRSNKDQPK
jgi:hypothetical protein